ncbi:unnamed protein product [Candidula unifasciata]|uniref:Secreted protein n=1 Tax=Candidula unifasciata TaxID=100452 RepID=A0A8S3Z3Y2_9EUPU|nr:unnamed protein product [Candidula unifasciata]
MGLLGSPSQLKTACFILMFSLQLYANVCNARLGGQTGTSLLPEHHEVLLATLYLPGVRKAPSHSSRSACLYAAVTVSIYKCGLTQDNLGVKERCLMWFSHCYNLLVLVR